MKHLLTLLLCTAGILCGMQSCQQSTEYETIDPNHEKAILSGAEYDNMLEDLAFAVSSATQNSAEFRNLVKTEVIKQFDGDYDLLLSQAFPIQINPGADIATRTGSECTVKDMLECYLPSRATRSGGSILDDIQEKYPELQISVPVHAEEWDPATYTPVVCFVPSDYVDLKTKTVKGIDAKGNEVDVDAINEPEKPVIVIGRNERSSSVGGWGGGGGLQPPVQIFRQPELSGTYSSGAARLSWTAGALGATTISGYKIYRSGPNTAGSFTLISTVSSSTKSYVDYNITSNMEYYYKVVAYGGVNVKSESEPIVIVANSSNLNPVENLSAEAINDWRIELKWKNPVGGNYKTQIERRTGESVMNYEVIATLEPSESTFIDDYIYLGEKHTYLVRKIDTQGRVSDAVSTYAYGTYRNPGAKSGVYLKQIVCNLREVESWIAGKPEFYLKVAGMGVDQQITEFNTCDVQFASASGISQIFNNKLIHNWSYFNFKDLKSYPALTFSLVEYDLPKVEVEIDMGVKVGAKVLDSIELSAGANIKVKFQSIDKKCGENSILYFENPEQWIQFPNYGARILISEKP